VTNVRQDDWADHLLQVEIAMPNSVNVTTGKSPTELLYGMHLCLIPHPADHKSDDIPGVNQFLDRIDESVELAKDRHVITKTWQAIQANWHHHEEPRYEVGDLVHLDTKNLRLKVKQKGCTAKFYL